MVKEDLKKQLLFISELEKLKVIYRANGIIDKSRFENSAEHSWHIALMAILLEDSSTFKSIDMLKVVKMLLIHDIVEIDAGDTFLYDEEGKREKKDKEKKAASRIFGLLPEKQRQEFTDLWEEYEERKTQEALYAASMDGLQPLINHYLTGRENENPYKMTKSNVIKKKIFIKDISSGLWEVALDIIEKSVDKGLYIDDVSKNISANKA